MYMAPQLDCAAAAEVNPNVARRTALATTIAKIFRYEKRFFMAILLKEYDEI